MSSSDMRHLLIAALALLAVPATADAAVEVRLTSSQLEITGDAFADDVTVTRTANGYRVREDTVRALDAILPCVKIGAEVECQRSGEAPIRAEMGAGDDTVKLVNVNSRATLFGENGDDTLNGGEAADSLNGGNGRDKLVGRDGNDSLAGGAGPDQHHGGAGLDTVTYHDHTGNVVADLEEGVGGAPSDVVTNLVGVTSRDFYSAVENLVGSPGFDTLIGNEVSNQLDGLGADDILLGRGGNDTLDGGPGPDLLQGDDGRDTVTYAGRTQSVRVSLDGDNNDGGPEDAQRDDVRDDVEVVEGSSNDDTLIGSDRNQTLRGNRGEDTLDGRGGADILEGGDDFDQLTGGAGPDAVIGGDGNDFTSYADRANGVSVTLDGVRDDGGPEDLNADMIDVEQVVGTEHDDTLAGGAGRDALQGLGGADVLRGGDNDDFLIGGAGPDLIEGEKGVDTAAYSAGGVRVTLDAIANDGNGSDASADDVRTENVQGSNEADELIGDAGANELLGQRGDDIVRGGAGDDRIAGGPGADLVTGEDGNDSIEANDGEPDRVACGAGLDLAALDLKDPDAADCETVRRAPVGELPGVSIAVRGGRVVLSCPRAVKTPTCAGHLTATGGGATTFRLRPGERRTARLRLPRGRVTLLATEKASDGRPRTARIIVQVR
jgi:Ca2+-binding RTX toxin-like protein